MHFHEMIGMYGLRETMFDVCEAYCIYSTLYHNGGLTKRCTTKGRGIDGQLSNMQFRPSPGLSLGSLTENGMEILYGLVKLYEGDAQADEIMAEWNAENPCPEDD